jgi:hypothetical protein
MGKTIREWNRLRGMDIQLGDEIWKKRPEELEPGFYAQLADSVS